MLAKVLNYIGILLMALVILLVLPLTVPKLFGFYIFGILTGSMEPEYPAGCAVYVKQIDFKDIKAGDPITYRLGTDTDLVATHRVVEIDSEQQTFITRGDANQSADANAVSYSQVIGKVVFQIPLLGKLSACLHTKTGVLACGGIFAAAMVLWVLAEKIKVKESAK